MPRVPMLDGPQVAQNTLPQVSLQPAQAARVQDVAGRQAEQMGQSMQRVGTAAGGIAQDMVREANQLIVNDGLDKVKNAALDLAYDPQAGFANLKGAQALYRPNDKSLEDEYGEKLQQVISDAYSGLKNDAQRQAFTSSANEILTSFRGQAMRHASQEYTTYGVSNAQGMQSTAMRDISLNWNNPEAVMSAVERIQAATYTEMRLGGKSPEWQKARARDLTSAAHKTAILSALQANDAGYADAYLRKFSGEMNADDILRVSGIIRESNDLAAGRHDADTTFQRFAPRLAPSDMDRAFEIAVGTESGGRQFDANGQPLTSKAGAIGIAQVMPGTGPEAARLADLPWDEERYRNDPDYNRALGRAYFGQQVKDFGGDLAKAYAAYNAGPGRLAGSLKKADDNGHPDQWLQYLPAETRAYVTKNTREFAAGLGQSKPTLLEMKADMLRQDPSIAGNPARLKAAETALESRYNDMTAALKQREDETLDTVYKTLYQNGGRMEGLDAGLRASIPGDKLGAVVEFAAKAAKGPTNDPAAWAEILSMPRAELAQMTPADFYRQFRTVLDDTHMEKGYALLKDAQGSPDGSHLEILTTAQRVKQAAQAAKIIPDDNSKANADQLKAFGQFNLAIEDRVRQFEKVDLQGKRKANSEELQKIIDTMLLDTVNVSRSYWRDKTDQPAVTLTPDQMQDAYVTVGDQEIKLATIPSSQRAQITAALRSRGRPVTEQAIASLWVAAGKPKD